MDILPSTILDLARYPADAFSALLNIKKQDPVTAIKREREKETTFKEKLCGFNPVKISLYSKIM